MDPNTTHFSSFAYHSWFCVLRSLEIILQLQWDTSQTRVKELSSNNGYRPFRLLVLLFKKKLGCSLCVLLYQVSSYRWWIWCFRRLIYGDVVICFWLGLRVRAWQAVACEAPHLISVLRKILEISNAGKVKNVNHWFERVYRKKKKNGHLQSNYSGWSLYKYFHRQQAQQRATSVSHHHLSPRLVSARHTIPLSRQREPCLPRAFA